MVFVVGDQTSVPYQDPVGLFKSPADGLRAEPLVLRVVFNGLDVGARGSAVKGALFLKPWSTSALLTAPPVCSATWSQQGDTRGVVMRTGGDDQAQNVHGQCPLRARHPFPGVPAGGSGGYLGGDVDLTRVQHYQGRVL